MSIPNNCVVSEWTPSSGTPTPVAVSLEELKSICYVDDDIVEDDLLLMSFEASAELLFTSYTGFPVFVSTRKIYYDYTALTSHAQSPITIGDCSIGMFYTTILVPSNGVVSVDSLTITHKDGTTETLQEGTDYTVLIVNRKATIYLEDSAISKLLQSELAKGQALVITVTGGFGDTADDVPSAVKEGIKFLVAYWYERREDQQIGNTLTSSAKTMWLAYKRFRG